MRDIDDIILALQAACPSILVEQLRVCHPGDDDGIWYFRYPGGHVEIQIESSYGTCPFLVEGDDSEVADHADSVEEAVRLVLRRLGLSQ